MRKKHRLEKENWMSSSILCPYYVGVVDGLIIQCEGFDKTMPRVSTQVRTRSARELKQFCDTYCAGEYKACGVCKMITREKYADL